MNQIGDKGIYGGYLHTYNKVPYRDYTNFTLLNGAKYISNIYKMTPLLVLTASLGEFFVQDFVTPQYVLQQPITYDNPNQFNIPPPQRVSPQIFFLSIKRSRLMKKSGFQMVRDSYSYAMVTTI